MDLETVFLSRFSIGKKPDIFELIGAAIQIGAWKHPAEFEKHKHGLLKVLMSPEKLGDDVEEDEVIDNGIAEIEEDEIMDGGVAEIKDEELINNGGAETEEGEGIDSGLTEIEQLAAEIEELVQEKTCRFQENYNDSNIKPTIQQSDNRFVYDKENKTEGGKCRIITSVKGSATKKFTKRSMLNMKLAEGKQLGGDCSRHKRLGEEEEKLNKQSNNSGRMLTITKEKESHKSGFKKTERHWVQHKHDRETKAKEGTQHILIQSNNKKTTDSNMGSVTKRRSALTNMNVAIKRVEVAPPREKLLISDCSEKKKLEEGDQFQKQNSCNNAITGTLKSKTGESIRDSEEIWAAKFASSKRKFDERFEEINKAKRRAIVVDFHHMPKTPKDPSTPRRCWDRRRF